MTRKILSAETDMNKLVPLYAHNKREADAYKKIAEEYGATIKQVMGDNSLKSYTAGYTTVTRTVSVRESFNDEKLLQVAKKHNLPVVRTVEVVDMDALEKYLYDNTVSPEVAADITDCKQSTEIVTLRIKEAKNV